MNLMQTEFIADCSQQSTFDFMGLLYEVKK